MSGNHRNGTPVYKRIQNAIRSRIESAELQPGDMVESERELAKTHKVSLMTARHALAGLEREGLVERRRGAGTFVASPKIHFNKLMSYTEHMSSRGLNPRSKVLFAKVIEHDSEVAARLALPATSTLVKIVRLRETGDEPFALETCYLPAKEFSELIKVNLGRNSPVCDLATELRRGTRLRRRRGGRYDRRCECRRNAGRPARGFRASHSASYLFDQGPGDYLWTRVLPLRAPHLIYSPLPLGT